MERGGTRALGVPVELDSMGVSPFSGRLGMDGFRVANPEGFSGEPVFRLDRGRVAVRVRSLFGDVIEIPEITLEGLHVRLERTASGVNLKRILDNLGGTGGDGRGASGDAGTGGAGPRVRVGLGGHRPGGRQRRPRAQLGERGRFELELPTIELRDIGTDGGGVTVAALIERITRVVIARLEEAGARELPDRIRRELRQRVERETEALEQRAQERVDQKKQELEQKKEQKKQELEQKKEEAKQRLRYEASKLLDR
ncbi:MAG: hypothetical protein U5K43_03945 [Halofilum sp. (in: g-proteobacteria)]|nr:hypothetical protein [Halofilum sp. (in: g-proteobacteria)]